MKIKIEVKPNKKKFKITSISKNKIIIETKSPATEGKANKEITSTLKKMLKSKVEITKGKKSKQKTLLIENEQKLLEMIKKNEKDTKK